MKGFFYVNQILMNQPILKLLENLVLQESISGSVFVKQHNSLIHFLCSLNYCVLYLSAHIKDSCTF